jgi:muramoyltetrapeptide carboxypeptidase
MESAGTVKPQRLRRGDRIGVISPAGPVNASELQPGLDILESSGFEVLLGRHVYNRRDYLAGDDKARLEDLHAMFRESTVKAVFCARGGYGSPRLLDKIDYDMIQGNPKILVGYSDITALLMAVHARTGLVTFHGPMVREFIQNEHGNWDNLLWLLSSEAPLALRLTDASVLLPGRANGPLMGGNLSLICNLIGTPFLPSLDQCLLFIEERGEHIYRLDRMLTHLALAGHLNGISGVIACEFLDCGDATAINGLLTDILSDFDIPVVTGLPVGHGLKNLALPLGAMAVLDTGRNILSTLEPCVRE